MLSFDLAFVYEVMLSAYALIRFLDLASLGFKLKSEKWTTLVNSFMKGVSSPSSILVISVAQYFSFSPTIATSHSFATLSSAFLLHGWWSNQKTLPPFALILLIIVLQTSITGSFRLRSVMKSTKSFP